METVFAKAPSDSNFADRPRTICVRGVRGVEFFSGNSEWFAAAWNRQGKPRRRIGRLPQILVLVWRPREPVGHLDSRRGNPERVNP